MNEILELSIAELAKRIRGREVGSLEYCDTVIARCESASRLNAIADHDWAALRQAAREADRSPSGRLAGVPLVFKDNIDTRGLTTAAGTGALKDFRPKRSAPVAQALFDDGALPGAKATMHELAFGITNNNAHTGPARNPYDPSMIPGGSSGGVAVAVAARLMPAGIGTDTGASVRLPAALCGCVGFRPTVGRYSQAGIVPISSTRDTAGPITRTVADAALIDAIIAGAGSVDDPPPREFRLGVPRGYFFADLDGEVATIVEATLARIAGEGIELVEADIPDIGERNSAVSAPIARFEFLRELKRYLAQHDLDIGMAEILDGVKSPDVRQVIVDELGEGAISEDAYLRALHEGRPRLQATYADYFATNRIDAAIFPTSPLPARPIGQDRFVDLDGKRVPTFDTFIRNTDPASNAGIPSLSLPVGLTRGGLPVAVEIDGPAGSDRRVLAIALALEGIVGAIPPPPLPS